MLQTANPWWRNWSVDHARDLGVTSVGSDGRHQLDHELFRPFEHLQEERVPIDQHPGDAEPLVVLRDLRSSSPIVSGRNE